MQNTLENQNQIIKTEVLAGCTTFVASVYIILTNALILSDAGISQDAAMMATIFTCALSTILMGVLSSRNGNKFIIYLYNSKFYGA